MSRDVSPEVCGWCGVEMPCECDDDMGGFGDMDSEESMSAKSTQKDAIIRELTRCLKTLGAEGDLLGVACSYGETYTDQQVLDELKHWNSVVAPDSVGDGAEDIGTLEDRCHKEQGSARAARAVRAAAVATPAPDPLCDDDVGGFDDMGGDEDHETERALNRGTSSCDGSCAPMCDWCLVSHSCPDDCGGGDGCPYRAAGQKEGEA